MAQALEGASPEVEAIEFSADDMAPKPRRWTSHGAGPDANVLLVEVHPRAR